MSQPCSTVELLLIDATTAMEARGAIRTLLAFAAGRGIARGAIAARPEAVELVETAGIAGDLDFWLGGSPGSWPVERALDLAGVEPGRTLLVSDDSALLDLAAGLGLLTAASAASSGILERLLA